MKRAVIVIDMLEEFVHGRLGSEKARNIVPACGKVIDHARAEGWPVIYSSDSHYKTDPEIAIWGEHAMVNTPGAKIIDELWPHPDERVFPKHTYSAFDNFALEHWIRMKISEDNNPDQSDGLELVLIGTATHICVAQTAIEAFERGFKVSVVSDATCGFMDTDDSYWLGHIAQLTGAWLPDSDALIRTTAGESFGRLKPIVLPEANVGQLP